MHGLLKEISIRKSELIPGRLASLARSPDFHANLGYMALTRRAVTIPEVMLIAGTRVALGVGLGLLISDWLNKDQRQAAGWALLGVGVY